MRTVYDEFAGQAKVEREDVVEVLVGFKA